MPSPYNGLNFIIATTFVYFLVHFFRRDSRKHGYARNPIIQKRGCMSADLFDIVKNWHGLKAMLMRHLFLFSFECFPKNMGYLSVKKENMDVLLK